MSPLPIHRGGAAEFSVRICVGGLDRLWLVGPVAGRVSSRCLQPATVAPPAAEPAAAMVMEVGIVVGKMEHHTWCSGVP
ncbi:hypothetical protein ACLOJK_027468 [Asimina triloba]